MATNNYTDTNWIPYGTNDSLSAIVFSTASVSTEAINDGSTTENDIGITDFPDNSTLESNWTTAAAAAFDSDYYGSNLTAGYNASLNVFPFAENGSSSVAFNNLYTNKSSMEAEVGNWSMVQPFQLYNVTSSVDNGTFAAAFADGDVWSKGVYAVDAAYNDTELVGATGINVTDGYSYAAGTVSDGGDGGGDYLYPSGHSVTTIAIAATVVTFIMIMVVVGNMLVIVAITTEKNLKTIQNWFIASLAVADFFIGLVVMPFSLAKELMGYWIFGTWWCEIHLALDVMLCTSSIMNLCLISLDRYWSITQAVDYLKKRTASRAAVMITIVWCLSFLISVPPLVGWNKLSQPVGEIPICEVSKDTLYVVYSASGSFFIPSVIMVFVYIQIYFAARSRARRVVKKHRPALDPTKDKSTTTTSFSNASPPDKNKNTPNTPNTPRCGEMPTIGEGVRSPQLLFPPSTPCISIIDSGGGGGGTTPPTMSTAVKTIGSVSSKRHDGVVSFQTDDANGTSRVETTSTTTGRNSSPANNNSGTRTPSPRDQPLLSGDDRRRLQVQLTSPTPVSTPTSSPLQRSNTTGGSGGGTTSHLGSRMFSIVATGERQKANGTSRSFKVKASPSRLVNQAHALAQAQAQILLSDDMECLSELDHSSDSDQLPNSESKPVSGFRRLTVLCIPSSRKAASSRAAAAAASAAASAQAQAQAQQEIDMARVVVPPKPRDPEREKRRIARKKERRATLILGLIMAAFILCWLPFFTLYMVRALCSFCSINDIIFSFAFWLGYCNSVLNPVIYTIFNKDFRKAFRKILFK